MHMVTHGFFTLCSRVVEATPDIIIVLPASGEAANVPLRKQDKSWKEFLAQAAQHMR